MSNKVLAVKIIGSIVLGVTLRSFIYHKQCDGVLVLCRSDFEGLSF